MTSNQAEPPVHEKLDVRKSNTIYKNSDWWKAVVLSDGFGRPEIGVYLWHRDGTEWKRKQKLKITSVDEWQHIEEVIDSFLEEL